MKVIVIGATGTIGGAVVNLLNTNHEVISASRSSKLAVDLQKSESIENIFSKYKDADAILCVAGEAAFGPLDYLTDDQFDLGLTSKLMGQVNLVRIARSLMKDNGVVVITTGILAQNPNAASSMVTMINRGLEGFVEAASMDMPRNMKLHAVSPPLAKETAIKMGWGPNGMPATEIAVLYQNAMESNKQGKVFGFH